MFLCSKTPARIKCLLLFCIAEAVVGIELREHLVRYQQIAPHLGAIICVFWSFVFGVLALVEFCSSQIANHVNREADMRTKEKKENMKPASHTGKQKCDEAILDEREQKSDESEVDRGTQQADVEKGRRDEHPANGVQEATVQEENVAEHPANGVQEATVEQEKVAAKLTLCTCICRCMRCWAWILHSVGRDLRAVTWLIFSMGFFVLAILSEMGVLGPLLSVLGIYCFIGILSIIVICWIGAVIGAVIHKVVEKVEKATGGRLGKIEEAILKLASVETALKEAKDTMNEMKENAALKLASVETTLKEAKETMSEMGENAATFASEMKNAAGKLPDDFKKAANDAVNAACQRADEMKKVVCCC